MVKKKGKINKFKKEVKEEVKEFKEDLKDELDYAGDWMKERRKFFIKLGWIVGVLIIILLVLKFI